MIYFFARYESLGASSRLRFFQLLPYFNHFIGEYKIDSLISNEMLIYFYKNKKHSKNKLIKSYIKRIKVLFFLKKGDIVFLEKELFPYSPFFLEKFFLRNVKLISDHDDAIFHQYDTSQYSFVRILLSKKIDKIYSLSDYVLCGSHYILDRALMSNKNSLFVPTVVDVTRYYVNSEKTNKVPVIVWIGTLSTSKYLKIIEGVLQSIAIKTHFKFRIIGIEVYHIPGINVECFPWSEENEVALLADSDIGIMPLFNQKSEKGKCGYKLIQYMASGLPVIASNVGENNIVVTSNCGFLVNDEEEWMIAFNELLTNVDLRTEMGFEGRLRVENIYSINHVTPIFKSLL
jgi:glycosyltransferase involved in cell wall biosynthesis